MTLEDLSGVIGGVWQVGAGVLRVVLF